MPRMKIGTKTETAVKMTIIKTAKTRAATAMLAITIKTEACRAAMVKTCKIGTMVIMAALIAVITAQIMATGNATIETREVGITNPEIMEIIPAGTADGTVASGAAPETIPIMTETGKTGCATM